jgi:cytochrome c oxidase cbb3-type subunit 3
MQLTKGLLATAFAGLMAAVAHTAAQGTSQTPPAGAQPAPAQEQPQPAPGAQPAPAAPQAPAGRGQAPGGRGRAGGRAVFPAQQRPLADPAVVARGKTIYEINCRSCHGPDLRGGDMGGPNLLRSQLVLNDQHGELILPVVRNGRQNPGMPVMPALPLPDADVTAVAEYIHSVAATMRGQGAPPPGEEPELDILVGDAKAGEAYFQAKCSSCHSPAGDLKGIASRITSPMQLQNLWVAGGGGRGGRGFGTPAAAGASVPRPVTVTVTTPAGQKTTGRLVRIDDFLVVLAGEDGLQRSFRRDGDVPRIEIDDPLETHKKLLTVYTDKDMHDVTAYLVTLK